MKAPSGDGELCKAHQKKMDAGELHFGTINQERPTIWGLVEGNEVTLVKSLKNKEGKEINWGQEDPVEDWDEHRDNLEKGLKPWGEGERPNKTVIKKSSGDAGLDKVIDTKETLKNLKAELKEALDMVENLKEKVTQAELDYKQAKITFVEEDEKEDEPVEDDKESVCSEDTLAYESEAEEEEEDKESVAEGYTTEQLKAIYKKNYPEQYKEKYPEEFETVPHETKVEELKKKFEPEEEDDSDDEEEIYKIITYKDGIDYQINSETKEVVRVDDFEMIGTWDDDLEEIIRYDDDDE
jgi:hypothetical protein